MSGASLIRPNLYVGGLPWEFVEGTTLKNVVSCIRIPERVRASAIRAGMEVDEHPFTDDIPPPSPMERRQIALAVRSTVRGVSAGRETGVFCAEGRNRSALVACLAIMLIDRLPAHEALALVRTRRSPAVGAVLTNWYFEDGLLRGTIP